MINGLVRFWSPEGPAKPGGPDTSLVTDFDQRRTISVTRCGEFDDEDEFYDHLRKHIDRLGPKVYKIEVSEEGELNTVSSKADDDETLCVHYPLLQEVEKPARVGIIARSELEELERLVPNVDLASYYEDASSYDGPKREKRVVVFKYYFHMQYLHQRWDEINIWMRLPPHPNIVPFDRLVVEELYGQQHVAGFTSLYIRGGTLFQVFNKYPSKQVFKLKWLLQLTSLVNDLNLKFGIEHQDIAPRNLIVDETTDNIMLFDFNCAARIGGPLRNGETVFHFENNDVKGVIFTLYEIITQDDSVFHIPIKARHVFTVMDLKDWTKHPDIQLDHPPKDYRAALDTWLKARKQREPVLIFTDAPEYIDWPPIREPSCLSHEDSTQPMFGKYAQPGSDGYAKADMAGQMPTCSALSKWEFYRRDERKSNRQLIEWQRTAGTKIEEGMRLFADGKTIESPLESPRWMPGK